VSFSFVYKAFPGSGSGACGIHSKPRRFRRFGMLPPPFWRRWILELSYARPPLHARMLRPPRPCLHPMRLTVSIRVFFFHRFPSPRGRFRFSSCFLNGPFLTTLSPLSVEFCLSLVFVLSSHQIPRRRSMAISALCPRFRKRRLPTN